LSIIEVDDLGLQLNLIERDTDNYQLNSPELNFPKFGLQLSEQNNEY
jgi:hypothetical protein|tara:strand:+ start:81 stop:221 length:141 start_codon:yes stop_codon:yes gene_type:complete